ncbi:MAG: chemotaxis protein CheW [Leptolyngbya sp. SIO1D8]|nr:chemotaxis protein CheW [Leptolyngbya sp. SIO1D8]
MIIPYLLFGLNDYLGGIKAEHVEEIFSLPELLLIPDAPLGIIGVIDFRGDPLPIIDLQSRDDNQSQPYQLTDSIIVLKQAPLRIGIIVSAIHTIREILSEDIKTEFSDDLNWDDSTSGRLLAGKIEGEENCFILGEPKDWFSASEVQQIISVTSFLINELRTATYDDQLTSEVALTEASSGIFAVEFCPTATPEERTIFRQRAENLRRSLDEDQPVEESKSLVVVGLRNQLFGIDSQLVREFITVRQAALIPCCPSHIIGNISLRGEILPIVDIGKPLNLASGNLPSAPKAMVVEWENNLVGVVVDEIRDAMFSVSPQDVQEVTDTVLSMQRDYVRGAVSYDEQTMHILDLPILLLSDEMVVNEGI